MGPRFQKRGNTINLGNYESAKVASMGPRF